MEELAARLDKLQTLAAESDIAGVVGQLREHMAEVGFQRFGWQALLDTVPYPGGGLKSAETEAAVKAGALEVAVAALHAHVTNEDVANAVCEVLLHLVQGFALEAGTSGVIDALLAVMRSQDKDLAVLMQACSVLL